MVGIASMPWEQHAEMLFGKLVDIIIHHNSYVFYHFVTVRALVLDKTIFCETEIELPTMSLGC